MNNLYISSPLHEKRLLMLFVKKQMPGRRAYSDITKVKVSDRQVNLYERQEQNSQKEVRSKDDTRI